MICTVSMPEMSSKNHPQLVYMSWAWRCISMSSKGAHVFFGVERRVAGMASKKRAIDFGAAIEENADVGVARGPYIAKKLCASCFSERRDGVAQLVERLAEWVAPLLVEAGLAAVAAAVGAPALDAVGAAPRGVFDDFAFVLGWKLRKEAGVVGELDGLVCIEQAEGVGEGHFAVLVMVAVGFAVGGDVNDLGFEACLESWTLRRAAKASPELSRPSNAMAREAGPL